MSVALVVSGTDLTALTGLLAGVGITDVPSASSAKDAKSLMEHIDADFVLINAPLPDDDGVALAEYAAANTLAATVLLSQDMKVEIASRLQSKGVLCLKKPLSPDKLINSLKYIWALRGRVSAVMHENAALKGELEEARLVARAKMLLMQYLNMSESDAHRFLEKKAMDQRVSKSAVAKDIIKTYEN